VLIAGRNFGCGSSREHAPQSLLRWGVQAIVAESFAEIFFGNCTSLGVPAVCCTRGDLDRLVAEVSANPQTEVCVDLVHKRVACGAFSCAASMPDSARQALVSGEWDFLGQLLEGQAAIRETADRLPYLSGFLGR
jgi:3-isopropylmalate/(R)-2-methylmalate dehydratase small subunit